MKPHTYFRLALLTPFFLWVIALLAGLLLSEIETEQEFLNLLLIPILFFAIGIILWFIPYMVVFIGLWLWSGNKSIPALRNVALTSPILFYALLLFEIVLVYTITDSLTEFIQSLVEISALLGVVSLFFGYLCVGIAFVVFKILKIKKVIVPEVEEAVPVL